LARRRFYVPEIRGGAAELRGEDARHLARVLRAEPGQRYEISDGRAAFVAEIAEARPDRIAFRTIEPAASVALAPRITLCAALVKFDRFEWIVEKATELGVERILPVEAERSEKGLLAAAAKRSERWRRIAHESGQQSRRLSPPEVLDAARFASAVAIEAEHRYFLDEDSTIPLVTALPPLRIGSDRVALLTGPEGGWTGAERERAAAAGWQPASLGPLVLRAETAAVAALAVVGSAWLA
jgi:16S rRNA (uracil1498-N3)-methyltransferase